MTKMSLEKFLGSIFFQASAGSFYMSPCLVLLQIRACYLKRWVEIGLKMGNYRKFVTQDITKENRRRQKLYL